MILRVISVLFGLGLIWAGARELFMWVRARGRTRRAQGVVVGSVDASERPGRRQRAATFRFAAEDGRVITCVTSVSAPWVSRAGKRVTVSYDPIHPEGAEIAWVKTFKLLVVLPVFVVAGLFFVANGIFLWME